MVLGAAWQLGLLPLSLESLTRAFELNNVAVKTNLEAFAWGRMAVVHPEAIESVLDPKAPAKEVSPRIAKLAEKLRLPAGTYREIALKRAGDLAAYQNAGLAKSYLERVEEFRKRAEGVFGADEELASAFARNLYKLIAYKDEYEVARLHLEWVAGEGSQAAKATMLLHPPVLRALGMKRKIKLNKSAKPAMTALHATRGLRGTRLDPFGRSDIRKRERALAAEYEAAMLDALAKAGADQTELLKRMAELPDLIRGYESVKERNLALYDQAWAEARTELGASRASLS
jgi:indolepyruvate ferredoxin oxidoreductase